MAFRERSVEQTAMPRRRGFTILELTVASIILATLMIVCMKWIAATGVQAREARWRQTATREAANLMERMVAYSWEEITPERAAKEEFSQEARQTLPDGAAEVQVAPSPDAPEAKRITIAVRWRPRREMPPAEVRLVAWKYRQAK